MDKHQKICVAIIGYNRKDYIEECVKSICRTPESKIWDFRFYIDYSESQSDIVKYIDSIDSIPHKKIIAREKNIGCGCNHILAKIDIFDNKRYDGAFILEDDLVVSRDFFEITLAAYKWASKKFSNVGVAQGYQACCEGREWKKTNLNKVTNRNDHWWGYYIPKTTWEKIKPILTYYYETFIMNRVYKKRDSQAIRRWTDGLRQKVKVHAIGSKPYKPPFVPNGIFNGTGQDAITSIATYLSGLERISTVVNHVKNIGERGINFSPNIFEKMSLNKIRLDEFDVLPSDFEVQ